LPPALGPAAINWDGKVLGCCVNYWGDFGGNAFRDGLTASVNTEQIQYARAMLLGRAPPRGDIPCTRCSEYKKMSKRGAWLERAPPRLQNWSRRWVPTIARRTLKKNILVSTAKLNVGYQSASRPH
jgi:hypothetical protein